MPRFRLFAAAVCISACSPSKPTAAKDAAVKNESRDAAVPVSKVEIPDVSYVERIDNIETFRAFADRPGGVIRSGEVIKFLIDNREYPRNDAPVYYINSNYTAGGKEPVSWVALHREWAEKVIPGFAYSLKKFSRTAYFTKSLEKRDFISGRIQSFEYKDRVFLAAWFIEMDLIHEEMIQAAMEHIGRTFKVEGHPVHFVAYSRHQTTATIKPWVEERGIEVYQLSDLLADVKFRSLNPGEAWGILRFAPEDPDNLEADEIPVFETLPLDLGVVAGTITTAFQDVASHVNIKSKQRRTPNLMLRDPAEIKRLRALDGKPVHLVVTSDGYKFELSSIETVAAKLEATLASREWKMPPSDLTDEIVSFDSMCAAGKPVECLERSTRFGGKAAGLGFLAHPDVIGIGSKMQKKLGYRTTPLGFAVPIASYKTFIDHNRARDAGLKADLDRLMSGEVRTKGTKPIDTAERRALVARIQKRILAGEFPPGLYERIAGELDAMAKAYAATFPGETLTKIKVRSSANVEDIPQFNGAGLHNSYTATIKARAGSSTGCALVEREKKDFSGQEAAGSPEGERLRPGSRTTKDSVKMALEPRSLACAIKAVYASLWNLRAVRERSFRRFDHRGALMGLAISPSYKHGKKSKLGKIAANSVLLTRILNTTTVYGYQLSTQVGGNLVTNPKPGTLAELTTLTFQLASVPAPTVLQYAKPKKKKPIRDEPILSDKTMRQIVALGRTVEEAYCRARPAYFVVDGKQRKCHQISNSQSKPSALDMELKIYKNGQILLKQVREFDGR